MNQSSAMNQGTSMSGMNDSTMNQNSTANSTTNQNSTTMNSTNNNTTTNNNNTSTMNSNNNMNSTGMAQDSTMSKPEEHNYIVRFDQNGQMTEETLNNDGTALVQRNPGWNNQNNQ